MDFNVFSKDAEIEIEIELLLKSALNNIVNNDETIEGNNNQVRGLVFTTPKAKLIVIW